MQIHELTYDQNSDAVLKEGLWDTIQALTTQNPNLAGMSLAAKKQFLQTNQAIDKVADKAVNAWSGYVARKTQQNPNWLSDDQIYRRDLRLFVQKNLMPPYTNIDQMTNKNEIYQAIDTLVSNRMDTQGRPSPQAQIGTFNQLIDLASVAMVKQPSQKTSKAAAPTGAAAAPTGAPTQFTPQAAQAFLQNFGMNQQQLQTFINTLPRVAGTNTVNSTGNPSIDNLLRAFGLTVS